MNFFNKNKNETPKKTEETSIVEKAKEVAGSATDLSLKAAALATLLSTGGHTMASEKNSKDEISINKIEQSSQQTSPKSTENTISWETAQKMSKIDSLENVKDSLIDRKKYIKTQFQVKADIYLTTVNKILKSLDKKEQVELNDALKLPGTINELYSYTEFLKSQKNVNLQEAKAKIAKLQDDIFNQTGLMSILSNKQISETYGSVSNDIINHIDFNKLRKEMIDLASDGRGTGFKIDDQEKFITQLNQDIADDAPLMTQN